MSQASQAARREREEKREAVKVLAIAVGAREAARQLGLNENTVISWSKRDNWQLEPAKPNGPARNQPAIKPSDALRSALEDDNRETKLSLSKGVRRLAKHIETLPEPVLFAGAANVKQAVSSASQLHNWEEKGEVGINLNVLSIGGEMALQINQK